MSNGSFGYILWISGRMIGTGSIFLPGNSAKEDVVRAIRTQAQESCKGTAVKFTVDEYSGIFPLYPSSARNVVVEHVGNGVHCLTDATCSCIVEPEDAGVDGPHHNERCAKHREG